MRSVGCGIDQARSILFPWTVTPDGTSKLWPLRELSGVFFAFTLLVHCSSPPTPHPPHTHALAPCRRRTLPCTRPASASQAVQSVRWQCSCMTVNARSSSESYRCSSRATVHSPATRQYPCRSCLMFLGHWGCCRAGASQSRPDAACRGAIIAGELKLHKWPTFRLRTSRSGDETFHRCAHALHACFLA